MELTIKEREIIPIMVWHEGQSVQINLISLDYFSGYTFDGGGGDVYYTLYSAQELTDEHEEGVTLMKMPIATGKIRVEGNILADWGMDDAPIFTHTMDQLGLFAK